MQVEGFFDEVTGTVSYLVFDPASRACAVIDPVADFDLHTGRLAYAQAERIAARMQALNAELEWVLETHVHADHLSAAPFFRDHFAARIGIGARLPEVRRAFAPMWPAEDARAAVASERFDRFFDDGDQFRIGELVVRVLATPGHTPACVSYLVADARAENFAAFVGDTLFMPDAGTARCDFPGGDAGTLYRSVRRLLSLPADTRLYTCHDYPPAGRAPCFQSTVAEQRAANVHVRDGIGQADFVALRQGRDATLCAPKLMLAAMQVNLRAGTLPEPESHGVRYLKIPLDVA
ncbi:MBL fold metallo-hydrolase [Xylophilus sp. GOD-11R]|uniref:MBL fold metallo-hydrolase n=1 Tax=Xylophilus sp. GOD-11R TaxID=3089814 RepID=UPI00298C46F9|nr:MBL fold metallo-hydrolase [Xylophilus sp. GOD-11R]WPB56306.1 MBL fold metallo-hydrolase [Xylophilus sp. GOD-11R]